ncbi:MAG: MarR family winged helix-turn-helix transcriptional regulator [Roseibium sp.]|uniref:MarR family winged helix-turn-helix transcriptional regulator n=1 Tax=Roseibium sp. TaxID=1936156 RepID=UPI003D9C42BE
MIKSPNQQAEDSDTFFAQPLHQFLTYRLSRVQAKLNTQAQRILSEAADISLIQWRIIALIGSSGDSHAGELTRRAALDKGLFSRNLKTLMKRGMVTSREDKADHRIAILSLTGDGHALYQKVLPIMRARQRALRSSMTKSELDTLHSALDKLEIAAERDDLDI